MHASMQRKWIRQEELSALPSKSLGRERSVSQNSRGDSSARTDAFAYIPAHQHDRRIGESNSDSRQKEFYDRRREAESSKDRGHEYTKDHKKDARDKKGGQDPKERRREFSPHPARDRSNYCTCTQALENVGTPLPLSTPCSNIGTNVIPLNPRVLKTGTKNRY